MAKRPLRSKGSAKGQKKSVPRPELVIITGLSGSGKGSVLRALEDLGYYSVDNMPVDLIPKFAELIQENPGVDSAALVVDVRERDGLERFPEMLPKLVCNRVAPRLVFLEADDDAIVRRFSETRRPHPLGTGRSIAKSIRMEREQLEPIRAKAELIVNTSKFTVHELREFIGERFRGKGEESKIMVYVTSFGFRNGVPPDSDLVFDVRFLPNPNYIPKFNTSPAGIRAVAKYHPLIPADGRVHEAYHRSAGVPVAALHSRRTSYLTDRLRLYRRTASLGNDGRSDPQSALARPDTKRR